MQALAVGQHHSIFGVWWRVVSLETVTTEEVASAYLAYLDRHPHKRLVGLHLALADADADTPDTRWRCSSCGRSGAFAARARRGQPR